MARWLSMRGPQLLWGAGGNPVATCTMQEKLFPLGARPFLFCSILGAAKGSASTVERVGDYGGTSGLS